MLIGYPGDSPVTIVVTLTPGYGIWPTPLEDDGSGNRSAANIFAGLEAVTSRTNTVWWRVALLNCIDGSAGNSAFIAAIINYNAWTFHNSVTIAAGAVLPILGAAYLDTSGGGLGTLYLGFFAPGHIVVGDDSDILVQGTSGHVARIRVPTFGKVDIESGGNLNTLAGGTANLGGQTNQTGRYTKTGAGAVVQNRTTLLPAHGTGGTTDDTLTIDGGDADIFTLAANITPLGQDMTITVATNAAAAGHRFIIRASSVTPGFGTVIVDAGGTEIGYFLDRTGAGVPSPPYFGGSMEFYYNASGTPTRLWVNTGVDLDGVGGGNSVVLARA
jgi:hypothetical protein